MQNNIFPEKLWLYMQNEIYKEIKILIKYRIINKVLSCQKNINQKIFYVNYHYFNIFLKKKLCYTYNL